MFRWAMWAVFVITVARLVWLALDRTDLYPDEAQYWVWAQHPDWGYFSKPPMVAWIIAAATRLLGDNGPAVRVAAPLLHFATAMTIYGSARLLYDPRTGFWSAVTYAALPGVSASAAVMSTDAPMLLCWAAALYAFLRARTSGDVRWWLIVGIAIGLGLLSKYAMAYWLLCAFLFTLTIREERRHLPMLLGATALGLVFYAPNFFWNYSNGFASYHHTEANASLGGTLFHPLNLVEFFGAQFGVFGPLLFAALIAMIALAGRTIRDSRAALLICFTLPPLALMLGLSLSVTRAAELGGAILCRGNHPCDRVAPGDGMADRADRVAGAASRRGGNHRCRGAQYRRRRGDQSPHQVRSVAPDRGLASVGTRRVA